MTNHLLRLGALYFRFKRFSCRSGVRRQYLSVIILGRRIASSPGSSGSTVDNSTSKHLRLLNLKTKVVCFVCFQPFYAATHVHISFKEILSSFQVEHREQHFAFALVFGVEKLFLCLTRRFQLLYWEHGLRGLKTFEGELFWQLGIFLLFRKCFIFRNKFCLELLFDKNVIQLKSFNENWNILWIFFW